MAAPQVTVLIDTFNYGHFIEQAIDSILSQEFPLDRVEILVVDDGSTDDTAQRVRKYGSRVQYLYKENGGQGSAFNLGFRHATGDFVALLDADDYFLPNKLRRVVEDSQSHQEAGMIYHSFLELDSNSGDFRETKIVPISGFVLDDKSKLLSYRIYPTSSMVFKRQALGRILPMPETIRIQADTYVSLIAPLLTPVCAIEEPLSVYRVHGQNLYHSQGKPLSPEQQERRSSTRTILSRELKSWAGSHMDCSASREARLFLNQWLLWMEEERFRVEPPGRVLFLWFLLKQNYFYSAIQTWRFTASNYVTSFFALIFGYDKAHLMYEWRDRTIAVAERAHRMVFGGRSKQRSAEGRK
jgi:glycosyltransferase involved in cell wall biosynthesis